MTTLDVGEKEDVGSFRDRARSWLAEVLPEFGGTDEGLVSAQGGEDGRRRAATGRALQRALWEGGFAGITFPIEYGGLGLSVAHRDAFHQEVRSAGPDAISLFNLIGPLWGLSIGLIAPTMLEFATEEQRRTYIPEMLRGDKLWVQMLSEPSGGSDLAADRPGRRAMLDALSAVPFLLGHGLVDPDMVVGGDLTFGPGKVVGGITRYGLRFYYDLAEFLRDKWDFGGRYYTKGHAFDFSATTQLLESLSAREKASMACPALPTCGLALAESERALPGISAQIDAILARTGATRVDIIAHSAGSVSSRYYIKNLGGDTKVDAWVSLAGPNHGTDDANNCSFTPCVELRLGPAFLAALNSGDETPGSVRYATWWSPCDETINPDSSVLLAGASNHQTSCLAHFNLLIDPLVFAQVKSWIE